MSRPHESDVTQDKIPNVDRKLVQPDEIPIVKAKKVHQINIFGNSYAAILVPGDGKKRCRWMDISLGDGKIKKNSKVIASACEGQAEWSHLGDANYEIFNVVPKNGELLIRLLVNYGRDLDIRLHIIAFNP